MTACPVPMTCSSTLLIERADMDLRTRAVLLSLHPRSGEVQGCLCGPNGLCAPELCKIPSGPVLQTKLYLKIITY